MPRVISVIESETTRGHGRTFDDPCRRVVEYHTTDGEFLAESDTCISFEFLVTLVRSHVNQKDRERFAKAILETEPIL